MTPLGQRIARLIAAQGPLSVAQFMTLALHDPEHGYYATRSPIGRDGDFITAPEISQMFGELLGLWFAQVWLDQGTPRNARLVELGPGRGALMADILRTASIVPGFRDAFEIVLVEASPTLTAEQKETLAATPVPVRWVTRLEDASGGGPLFLVTNEFFDALPIRQYVKTQRGWCERMVTAGEDGRLAFALAPVPAQGFSPPEARGDAPEGGVYEVSPPATALADEIARMIAMHGGAALVVDYGYAGSGFGETLQAVRAHRHDEVLASPGEADLSAHVDFAALTDAARKAGAAAFGPVSQARLLQSLGIEIRARQLGDANPREADTIAAALRRLTHADAMGELFKAAAILPPNSPPPPGF